MPKSWLKAGKASSMTFRDEKSVWICEKSIDCGAITKRRISYQHNTVPIGMIGDSSFYMLFLFVLSIYFNCDLYLRAALSFPVCEGVDIDCWFFLMFSLYFIQFTCNIYLNTQRQTNKHEHRTRRTNTSRLDEWRCPLEDWMIVCRFLTPPSLK
jgi:hypothetical protein